jgi:NADH-quinone oxidoreductase subunit G
MDAHRTIHEPKPPIDLDSPLTFTMEGFGGIPPSALIPRFWAAGWNSVQALNKFQAEVGGALRGGDPGTRLIEPPEGSKIEYGAKIPRAFAAKEGLFLIVPLYHVFGSDELSILTPGVKKRSPEAYLALSPKDMSGLGIPQGGAAVLSVEGRAYRLAARPLPALSPGVAGLGYGLLGSPVLSFPAWGRVERAQP